MNRGRRCGDRVPARARFRIRTGLDLFVEDGAYTTVASAVAMLMVLALVFSAAHAVWSSSRAGDVQVAADATALAGSNVVASYHTAATVLDASILSMGLAGLAMSGAGLVGLLIPGANALAGETIDAGLRMLRTRNEFAVSASRGLERLEGSLPYLVAANAARTCAAQDTESLTYTGTALAVPRESASDFPALAGEQIETGGLETASDALDGIADRLARAAEETAAANEAAWIADCGRDGMNMQERASRLSGISPAQNPDFSSSIAWNPNVALDRARAYYRWRFEHDVPEGSGVEEQADAAARHAFYGYACEQLSDAEVTESGGRASHNVELLPKNTDEVRRTALYTDASWPSSSESEGLTLHFAATCPGATGGSGPMLALSSIEDGAAKECPVCRFGVGDVGKAPAASTSIDNGFEYHLREFTRALDDYVACRNRELRLERQAKEEAEAAGDSFDAALSTLAGKRPRIAPPGRNGCIALVVSGETDAPVELETTFAQSPELERRGAVSASALAPDAATRENNVLAGFLTAMEERTGGGGAVGLIDDVMGLWGDLLISYGELGEGLDSLMDELLGGLDALGGGEISFWLGERIDGAIRGLGFEAIDLSARKPVLTDSSNVIAASGMTGLADTQGLLRSIPLGATDPAALMQAVGYEVGAYLSSVEFTIAEIPLPSGVSIPLTVRLRDLSGAFGGAG